MIVRRRALADLAAPSPRPAGGRLAPVAREGWTDKPRRSSVSGSSGQRFRNALKGAIGVLVAAGLWDLGRSVGVVDPNDLPSILEILRAVLAAFLDGRLATAVLQTLAAWAVGVAAAVGLGVPAGILIGLSPEAERTTRPLIEFMRPIPSVALIPIAIIWFGLGFEMKIFLIAFACVWPILFNAKAGVAGIDIRYIETGTIFGLRPRQVLLRIILPAALPSIATGVRIAASIGLVLAITAEMLVGRVGLGFWLESSRMAGQSSEVWAGIFVAGGLGLAVNLGMVAGERRLLHWSVEHRAKA